MESDFVFQYWLDKETREMFAAARKRRREATLKWRASVLKHTRTASRATLKSSYLARDHY